jgi:predicted TIM-barrel fold metal-dependent hydrolase
LELKVIIDFHTHIFPSEIRDHRDAYFADEPEFKLLYASSKSRAVGAATLIEEMDVHGVDKSVIFGFPWRNFTTLRRHNDYILRAVAAYPSRLIGFCCLNPAHGKALSEAERCINSGLSGIGELAFYQSDLTADLMRSVDPLMAFAREKDQPLLIHTNEPVGHEYPGKSPMTLNALYRMILRFPENKIVLAHWGGGLFFYHLLKKEVKEAFKNIYFDTAASPFVYEPSVYAVALRIVGREKILFGSDFPLLNPGRYFEDWESSGLSEKDVHHISGLNAATLLNL